MRSLAVSMPTSAAPTAGGRLVANGDRLLPLRHAHVTAEAASGLCRTVLTQRFVNPHEEPLDVTYLLPLPADGAVSGFSFTLGEIRVVGEVDARKKARERFERALASGRTAALLEQDRSSLFTQEVGNLPAGEEIVCEVVIDQPLIWIEEGAWEWRFPTVVGPRYQGAPGTVRDAAKTTVDVAEHGVSARSSLALSIGDQLHGSVESTSHRVKTVDDEVRFEEARLDRDIVVRWPVATLEPGVSISCARPARHDGTTFALLTVVPPLAGAMEAQARDLILLLDTSGSMSGRPLDQLKRVSLALVDSLGDRDRLELIEFGSTPRRFRAEPIRATRDGKQAAGTWLKGLRARGGTEMHRAVLEALRPLRADAQRQVVLMTDGYIGFEADIVRTLMDGRPDGVRLHTVGVGSAPNRALTQAAARAGNGFELIVGLEEDAERAASRLLVRTASPLVTDLRIVGATEVAPRRMPDLHAGCPALVSVACDVGATVTLRGRTARGDFDHSVEVPKLELGEGAIGVAVRFGRQKVQDLEMSLSAGAPADEVDESIEDVGLRFQIATRLTSWIAVTENRTVETPARRRERQPHELASGVSIEGLGLRSARAVGTLALAEPRLEQTLAGVAQLPAPQRRAMLKRAKARIAPAPAPRSRPGAAPPSAGAAMPAAPAPAKGGEELDLAAGDAGLEAMREGRRSESPSVVPARRRSKKHRARLLALILAIIVAALLSAWWVATR